MTSAMTVFEYAVLLARAKGWKVTQSPDVVLGEVVIDRTSVMVHPDSDTWTLAMNAGKLLPPNR